MAEHWQAVSAAVAAAIVGGIALLTRYMFVAKKDCADYRDHCNQTLCGKIEVLSVRSKDLANGAILMDREARKTLDRINVSILELNKSLSELKGKFDQYIINGKT